MINKFRLFKNSLQLSYCTRFILKSLFFLILLLTFGSTLPAFATVYFGAYDPSTGLTALAYSSSGGNFWQTAIAGKGMVGEGALGACRPARPRIAELIAEKKSAQEIIDTVNAICKDYIDMEEYYRLTVVLADGTLKNYIGSEACPDHGHCGGFQGKNFIIAGGGLEEGVLEGTRDYWNSLSLQIPFYCRVYKTLQKIYLLGGEVYSFKGASIAFNHPQWKNLAYFYSNKLRLDKSEIDFVDQIGLQMKHDLNANCHY